MVLSSKCNSLENLSQAASRARPACGIVEWRSERLGTVKVYRFAKMDGSTVADSLRAISHPFVGCDSEV